jgi:hypothetical protein
MISTTRCTPAQRRAWASASTCRRSRSWSPKTRSSDTKAATSSRPTASTTKNPSRDLGTHPRPPRLRGRCVILCRVRSQRSVESTGTRPRHQPLRTPSPLRPRQQCRPLRLRLRVLAKRSRRRRAPHPQHRHHLAHPRCIRLLHRHHQGLGLCHRLRRPGIDRRRPGIDRRRLHQHRRCRPASRRLLGLQERRSARRCHHRHRRRRHQRHLRPPNPATPRSTRPARQAGARPRQLFSDGPGWNETVSDGWRRSSGSTMSSKMRPAPAGRRSALQPAAVAPGRVDSCSGSRFG